MGDYKKLLCYIIVTSLSVTMQNIYKKGMTPQYIHNGVNTHNDFIMSKNTFKKTCEKMYTYVEMAKEPVSDAFSLADGINFPLNHGTCPCYLQK